jgi:hypothetical protein
MRRETIARPGDHALATPDPGAARFSFEVNVLRVSLRQAAL